MHQKLLKAGLLGVIFMFVGLIFTGCVDEPNPPVIDRVTSLVRFVHGVSDAPTVDIWIDGEKIGSFDYKNRINYMEINAGNRFLRLVPAGQDTSKAVFRQLVSVRSYTKITAVFYGLVSIDNVKLLMTQERFTYSDETKKLVDSADVKLINVNAREEGIQLVDSTLGNPTYGKTLIATVNANSLSAYKKIYYGNYAFYLISSGGLEMMSFSHDLKWSSTQGYRYTFIYVGDSVNQDVLTLQDDPY